MAEALSREVQGPRVLRELRERQLGIFANLKIRRDYNYLGEDGTNSGGWSEEARVLIEYVFSAALASEPGNPAGFRQAMESAEVEGWKGGVITEFQNFEKRKVYKIVPRGEVHNGKKILKTRWVFRTKFKEDGSKVYRSRAVMKATIRFQGSTSLNRLLQW